MPSPEAEPTPVADRGARWTLPLAAAVTLGVLRERLHGLFDGTSELGHFFDRAIGVTTLEGIDASGYARNFVALQLLTAVVFLAVFALLQWLRRRLDRWSDPAAPEHLWIARLAEIWAAVALSDVFFRDSHLATLAGFLGHLVALALAILVGRTWLRRRGGERAHVLLAADHHFVLASLLWPSSFLFAGWTLWAAFTGAMALQMEWTTAWFLVYVPLWLALLWASARRPDRRLMTALVPWMLVPAAMTLANELHAVHRTVPAQTWASILVALLALASAATWRWLPGLLARRGRSLPEPRWLLHALYFPCAVLSMALLRTYSATNNLGDLDYFHLGESTVPTHQLFEFSALPLLDIRPAHTLSDMFWQSLYVLVHGFDPGAPLDMTLWTRCLPYAAALLLIYFVLARLLSPGYALLAVVLLPVTSALRSYYAPALIPALLLARALARPTVRRFVALWLGVLFLALWRIDFGIMGGVALACVLAPHLLDVRSLVSRRLRAPHRLYTAGKSLLWASAAGFACLLALLAVRGPAALDRLAFLVGSYSYRLITRTRSEVIHDFDLAAVLQYHVLPWVALVVVLFYAIRRVVLPRFVPAHQSMLAFLAAFSLIVSVRSMERHSLVELFNPYLAVFLLALLPVLFGRLGLARERQSTRAAFAAVLVLYSLSALPPADYSRAEPDSAAALLRPQVFRFAKLRPEQPRVRFHEAKHRQLAAFLADRLEDDQTFYDFTNSPLLYVLTDRQFPTYVIPNLIQTSETVQADVLRQLDSLRDAGRLPLVVFKQGHHFWDNTDDVANEVRCYRITEWIYRHYLPAVQVGPYQVWQEKDLPPIVADASDTVHDLTYGPRPVLWNLRQRERDGMRHFEATGDDANLIRLFDLSSLPDLDEASSWQLELRPTWNGDRPLQVFFAYDGGHFKAENTQWIPASESGRQVDLRIQPQDRAKRLTDVRIDVPDGSTLTLGPASLRIGSNVAPLTREQLAQSFHLQKLAAIWARLDPLDARTETQVIAKLLPRPQRLEPHQALILKVPELAPDDIADGTYLHLQIVPIVPMTPGDEATLAIHYPPAKSPAAFFFDLAPAHGVVTVLERNPEEQLIAVETFPKLPRWVYRATGPEPEIVEPFEIDALPTPEPGGQLRLRLRYRSRAAGRMAVCIDCDSLRVDGPSPSTPFVQTADSGEPAVMELPLDHHLDSAGGRPKLRLALRFADQTPGATPPMFEVVEAELVNAAGGGIDYLIRLSTQWRWASGDVDRLILRNGNRPVVVEGAWLRAGD